MAGSVKSVDAAIALETSIAGGSASLYLRGMEIDSWVGADSLSRSEDVPEILDTLLKRNQIGKERVGLTAVSVGLGSFTGTRIGLATALGLRKALGCRIVRVPLLRALAEDVGSDSAVFAAVSINNREVGWQVFSGSGDPPVPEVCLFSEFIDRFSEFAKGQGSSVFSSSLFESIRKARPELIGKNVLEAGGNLAAYIGKWAIRNPSGQNPPRVYSTGFRR